MLTSKQKLPLVHLVLVGFLPGFLKKRIYRLKGYDIHESASLGLGSVVVGEEVYIGPEASIGMLTIVQGRSISIGPRVVIGMLTVLDCPKIEIGEGTRINNQVVVGGMLSPDSAFSIGRNCILMEWSFVNTTMPVTIGDDVGIGGHCLFFTHGMWPNTYEGFPAKFAPIEIADQAWLAWRVAVLPGVHIGSRAIVSSDACVVKDIPAGALAAGVPAKVLQEDEAYISGHGLEENAARLKTALEEFIRWLRFHGIEAAWQGADQIVVHNKRAKMPASHIHIRWNEHDRLLRQEGANACLLSLVALDPSQRLDLEASGFSWLDIPSKERSRSGGDLTDEVEHFLHRGGLRLLKYSRWNGDPA